MVMSGVSSGGAVDGWIGPAGSVSDPSVPYPAGFTSHPEGFAGVILGSSTTGGGTLNLYCININTVTYDGIGYNRGTWAESNVHNVGYVAYLLNHYYPTVPTAPASLADANQKAAAVQAAIWYFSDNYVLTATDPLRPAVAAIVEDAWTT
jgi:TQXA domain-containing protein